MRGYGPWESARLKTNTRITLWTVVELWGNCGAGRSRLRRSDVGSRSGYVQEKRLEGCRHSLGNTLEEVVKGENPRLRR